MTYKETVGVTSENIEYAINVQDLTKSFNGTTAVDKISFAVETGELFGLLGPNGAGKTTTINMLSTLLTPTSGIAAVAGYDIAKNRDEVRNSIGIVFQETALDERLTARENLEFHSVMYGMEKDIRRKRIDEVFELVELSDKADVIVEKYSGGMKRRLEIARGLVHHPKVLFLDEPSLGLDAQTRRHIWEYIKKLNQESRITIILTTHYMEEADFLCERVAIIDHGKIVAMDSPKNLKDSLGGDVVSLEFDTNSDSLEAELKAFEWVRGLDKHNGTIDLKVRNADRHVPDLFAFSEKKGVAINSVSIRKPSLEDVFLKYTGKTMREREATQADRNREMATRRPRH